MSTYTKITDFAAKDALLTGNPAKIVKGTEIGAEFDAIAVADASNVKGPTVSVTDNAVVRWDTTTGRIVQGSSVTIDDSGNIAGTSFTGAHNGTVGATTPSTGAFTTLSATVNQNAESATTQNNTTVGTASSAMFVAQSDSANTKFGTLSSGYTTSGVFQANSGYVYAGSSLSVATAGVIRFAAGGTAEVGKFDASGNLLLQNSANGGHGLYYSAGQSFQTIAHVNLTPTGTSYASYFYNGTGIGSITQSGTTAVLYNTTSDYRLKTVIAPVSGSGSRIDALNPVEYEWKADGTRTRGFLAHEFQAVYAQSVNGTKDAVDADGNPIYQSMQAGSSEVIADLVAEIKSLRARITALEAV